MKKTFVIVPVLLLCAVFALAQNVGLGTTNPTAQFHTTGTVRHAILSGAGIRPVFTDANGNLLVNMPPLPASSANNNTAMIIPDINCTGVTSVNTLAGLPASVQAASIRVTLNITHPRLADLSIYLTAPNGSIINLSAPAGGPGGGNFTNTIFTDAGAPLSTGTSPYSGQYKPLANMDVSICGITPTVASFGAIGAGAVNPNGSWSLRIIDNTGGNTGILNNWSVSVSSGLGISGIWGLQGNSGTNSNNFIGTVDKQPLRFKVNNIQSGLIDTTGNTFFGLGSGKTNSSGRENTGIGTSALLNNIGGQSNTATGVSSLLENESGSFNTATGTSALLLNTAGNYNTANGYNALFINQTGNNNTAVGGNALFYNQQNDIVGVGESALYNNTSGLRNTAVGTRALFANGEGSNNTAQGFHALANNTNGSYNTAMGTFSLSSVILAEGNTAVGSYSLLNNTKGYYNVAIGADALHQDTSGNNNTALGTSALYANTSGNDNSATGYHALATNTEGVANVANGYAALITNTTGYYNTAIGYTALSSNTTGALNTALGSQADVGSGNINNATAVGYGAIASSSNKIRLGNAAVTVIEGQVPFTTPSDGRFKTNITETVKGLDFIRRLRPVVYNFQAKKYEEFLRKDIPTNARYASRQDFTESEKIRQSGFVAQEVEKAAKESGYDFNGIVIPQNNNQSYSLSYSQFVVPLVKAVQEQQAIIEQQNKKIELLLKEIQLIKVKLK